MPRLTGLLLVCVSFLFVTIALGGFDTDVLRQWNDFKVRYGKSYASVTEEKKRFEAFINNLERLSAFKKTASSSAQYGVTKFFDLSREEFSQRYLHPLGPKKAAPIVHAQPSLDLPVNAWDWSQKGAVTAVKDEGNGCGATWAMAAVDTLESVCQIAGHRLLPLSTQQVLDCDTKGADQGCNGGFPFGAYQYLIAAGGIESEVSYPYTGEDDECGADKSKFVPCKPWGYSNITTGANGEQRLVDWLFNASPVTVCVDAGQDAFVTYNGGTLTHADCPGTAADHCLSLVGWDFINGTSVWKLKNQWGTDWGVGGYVYFEMGTNTCGIDSDNTAAPYAK